MKHKRIRRPRLKERVVEVERNGDYLSVRIELNGQLLVGKYMRYGWNGPATTAEQEIQRLLSSSPPSSDDYSTAVHEAAHAVIARVLKIPCGRATIIADDVSDGRTHVEPPETIYYRWEQERWSSFEDGGSMPPRERSLRSARIAYILAAMSGHEASVTFLGWSGNDDSDREIIDAHLNDEDEEKIGVPEARLRSFARQLVQRHRSKIEAVANKLVSERQLPGDAIDNLIRQT